MHNFDVVVTEADGGEGRRGQNGNPHESISQISPQQGWNHDGNGNQQAAHCGSPGFFLVGFGSLFADVLSDLKFAEAINDKRANDKSREQRGETGERGPKGQIAEDAKRRKIMKQLLVQQPIKQSASVSSLVVSR